MQGIRFPTRLDFTQNLIWVGICIGILYWLLESLIHVVIFKQGRLLPHIFTPDPHELWKRFLVITLLLIFTYYAQRSINIRRRTEEALALALGELDQIFQTASVGMRVIDHDFNVVRINKTFERITRVSYQDAVGKKCYEVFKGPRCFKPDCPLTLIANGMDSVECQINKTRPDGSSIPCILNATPFKSPDGVFIGIVESFKDITELEKAKEAIRKKRDKLQRILSSMKEGVCIVTPEYKIEFQNITHKNLTGDREGGLCYKAFYGRSAPCRPCLMKKAIESGTTRQCEFTTSSNKSFEQSYTPIVDIDGREKTVVLIRDVSTEKNAITAMMQAEQLAVLGELAAGVAHEINNPINGVINYAQILLNKYNDHHFIRDIAQRVIKESDRIAHIVEGLLFFSRARREEKSPMAINDILNDSITLTASQLKKENIILKIDVPHDVPHIFAYPHEIEQVFLNLISNARYALNQKYPEPNEDKVLEIKAHTLNSPTRPFVKVSFRDHGIGIPAAIIDKVRNPFFTTKKGRHSTGLGLSISHGIIEEHGGKLLIKSVENHYTDISVNLPIHQ
jgi:PAS domain S-box-containing protein